VRSSRFSTMTRLPPGNGTEYPLTPCLDARKNPRLRETLESKSLRASEIVGCIGCSALGPLGVASAIRAHRRSRAKTKASSLFRRMGPLSFPVGCTCLG